MSDRSELDTLRDKLADAEARLEKSEKMASLGNLVAGVAHEINTPVGSINSNSDLMVRALEKLRNILADAPELAGQRELTRILDALEDVGRVNQTACTRIVTLVKSLKKFARQQPEACRCDLHEEIDAALTLVHHELKNRIEVVKEYGELPRVECVPSALSQVFVNLLVNASQAIDGKGTIRIRTRRRNDDQVEIEIEDSGVGIPPELIDKVFDAGFTTKKVGDGTGLGLAICYKIVSAHNGRIDVTSEPSKGTSFTVSLPITRPTDSGASTER